ncbi:MAG: hypothetical protein ACYCST_14180 [Acidimicrobiales bacterium]
MRRFRSLQVALGLLWLLDGLLQLQPANLSASFAGQVIDNAMAQPDWIQKMVVWTASILSAHPVSAGVTVAMVQVALGAAILHPRSRRIGLICSVVWALGVWVLGEGLGNLATGFAMLPSGAPGAALLYGLAAVVLLPSSDAARLGDDQVTAAAAFGALGAQGAAVAWSVLWFGAAILQAVPVESLGFKISANFQMVSLGEPGAMAALDRVEAGFAATHGPELTAALLTLELMAAGAALLHGAWRGRLLAGVLALLPILWIGGENMGGLLTGRAIDVGVMPVYVLIAIAIFPLGADSPARTGVTDTGSCGRSIAGSHAHSTAPMPS